MWLRPVQGLAALGQVVGRDPYPGEDDDPWIPGPVTPGGGSPDLPVTPGGGSPDLPPDFVAPGPTELHPERWDLDAQPYALYTVAWGDTYVGLAKTYLDPSGLRWREIWNLNRATTPDPDRIYVGQVLKMPDEARENMRRWLRGGGDPNVNPSQIEPGRGATDTVRKWWPWAAGAAVVGGALYWMS